MSFSKILSQPGMFSHKLERTVAFEELQGFADRDSCWQFNKQVNMVNSNMQLVDFTPMLDSNFCDESLDINSDSIKFKGVPSILGLPNKVEGILPEGMFKTFQFHFFAPQTVARNKAHAKFVNLVQEGTIYPLYDNNLTELNIMGGGLSSSA